MPVSPESEAEFRAAVGEYLMRMLAEGLSPDEAIARGREIFEIARKDAVAGKRASLKVVSKPKDGQ
jgi:hypothetical protein